MATKAELQAELDTLGVEYASKANKDELTELLHDALTSARPAEGSAATAGEPGTAEVVREVPTTSRQARRDAIPELPEQLVAARDARRRRYELNADGRLTFRAPPQALRQGMAGTEPEADEG